MSGVQILVMHPLDAAPRLSASSWSRSRAGRRYGLELTLVVVAKLIALIILYFAFIAPQPRTELSPGALEQHLLDANSATPYDPSP